MHRYTEERDVLNKYGLSPARFISDDLLQRENISLVLPAFIVNYMLGLISITAVMNSDAAWLY